MMEGNILKRDLQQFQINEELDLRTRLLMREAECIIKVSKCFLLLHSEYLDILKALRTHAHIPFVVYNIKIFAYIV